MSADRAPLTTVYGDRGGSRDDLSLHVPKHVHPALLPDLADTGTVQVRPSLVGSAIARWGDANRPHDLPGFGADLADMGVLDPDQVNDTGFIAPGAVFAYEAVRQASGEVATVDAEYTAPVNAPDRIVPAVERTSTGETVTYTRPDIDAVTATVDLTYRDGHPATRASRNGAAAEKLPGVLGLESQEGRILLGIDATLGSGTGTLDVTRETDPEPVHDPDEKPYHIRDTTYGVSDGSTVTMRLLEIDEAAYREAVGAYEAPPDPLTGRA